MKKTILITILCVVLQVANLHAQQKYEANWASIDSRPVPEWYTDAKFGIFIFWGLYSVPAWAPTTENRYAEWYWSQLESGNAKFTDFHNKTYGEDFSYRDFVKDFNCEMFDPDSWATLFRESGARYVVLSSKHHDGYTLWPSTHSWNWNSVDLEPHRDLVGELSTAVKKQGLHMGYYFSLYEWFNPLYHNDLEKYVDNHMIPQMKDLINRYEPDLFYADGEWDHPSEKWKSTEFLAWLYNESPVKERVAVNDRWGNDSRGKHGGYYTTEYDHDYSDAMRTHPWEECRGIGGSFGYNRNENIADYNTSAELVHQLVKKVAGGGTLLLDVGPTADGRIPVIMQQRLMDMGRWLKTNGEAIYGTTNLRVAARPEIDAYFTAKGKDLYVIFTKYPGKAVTIPDIPGKASSVSFLGSDVKVKYSQNGKNLTITPPVISPAGNPGEYAWVFKISGCL